MPKIIWKKAILNEDANLGSAIKCLNQSSLQIVLIVNNKDRLIGTLTDGDIRRGLLKGLDLKNSIKQLINRSPILTQKTKKDKPLMEMMRKLKIIQLPVINKNNQIIGLHLWDEVETNPKKTNLVLIMAGGFGKRLGLLTKKTPKPLLPIRGKPMLSLILEKIKMEGFVNVVISVYYQKDKIINYFQDGSRFGLNIKYIEEKKPLGTAGAISMIPRQFSPFFVLNADILSDFSLNNFLQYHKSNECIASVAVKPDTQEFSFGIVKTNGVQILGFHEKPLFSFLYNAGIYCLDHNVIPLVPKNKHLDMPDLLTKLIHKKKKVVAFPLHEQWQDLGTLKTYSQAND